MKITMEKGQTHGNIIHTDSKQILDMLIEMRKEHKLLADKFDTVDKDVREIKIAVVGNDSIGYVGLVRDVQQLKEESEKYKVTKANFIGWVTGASVAISVSVKLIFDYFSIKK